MQKNKVYRVVEKKSFFRVLTAAFLVFVTVSISFAQYKGAPVKKDRLLKALKSRQLQTDDIVSVINTNGVDFQLTDDVKRSLVAAGARPEVIKAVAENVRSGDNNIAKSKRRKKNSAADYDELLSQAIASYKDQKNSATAINFLKTAIKLKPKDPKAYQMLGFVNLYGLNNQSEAQKYMREAILNGGSAVFRVYHDDKGSFTKRCSGSLYISPERIRFESDDNIHTFETSTVNIDKIILDKESSKTWKNYPIFKVFLKIGKSEAKFRFAPISGKSGESQMASQFIEESKANTFTKAAMF